MNKSQAKALGGAAVTFALPFGAVILVGYALYRFGKRVAAEMPSNKVRHMERIAYQRPRETA